MARTTTKGLHVWDQTTDPFSHSELAANWDLVDLLLSQPAQAIQILATVPTVGNFAGRMVMLSAPDSGFAAWTLIRYDGSAYRAVGPLEILAAVPTVGNYPGRIVILSAPSGGFNIWSVIGYDGTSWTIIGGFASINTGGGAQNISGLSTSGDVYFTNSGRGPVLTDRVTGNKYRLFMYNGKLESEQVS